MTQLVFYVTLVFCRKPYGCKLEETELRRCMINTHTHDTRRSIINNNVWRMRFNQPQRLTRLIEKKRVADRHDRRREPNIER